MLVRLLVVDCTKRPKQNTNNSSVEVQDAIDKFEPIVVVWLALALPRMPHTSYDRVLKLAPAYHHLDQCFQYFNFRVFRSNS